MLKKIAFAGVGIALLASPLLASADTLSDLQTQIAGLLGQLKQLQTQLGQTQGANPTTNSGGGVGIAVPASLYPVDPISICPAFRRVLVYGVRGDDVVQLQKFLVAQGLLSDDSATGFFGRMTAMIKFSTDTGGLISLKSWYYQTFFFPLGPPMVTSLLHSLFYVLVLYGIAYVMYKRNWIVKV